MRPELVIFDCDGVLVDTEVTVNTAISKNLAGHGLVLSPSDCLSLFVGGTMQSAMVEAQRRGADLAADWLDEIYGDVFAALAQGGVSGRRIHMVRPSPIRHFWRWRRSSLALRPRPVS